MPAPSQARSFPAAPRQRLGFSRALLLVLWCFVLWGTWLGLGLAWMVVSQSPRAAWATLPGTPPDLMLRLGQGRLFAAGRRHDAGADAAPTMVVDLAAATVLGAVPAAPLALSTTGWILAPVPPPPCPPGSLCPARISTGAAEGPLRWMRPTR